MNRAYASTSSKCMSASCIFFSFASLNVLLLLWCQHMKHTHAYLPIPSHYLCGNTFAGISNSDGKWIASTQCKSSYQYFFVIFPNDANANGSQMMMILVSDELWLMMMNLLYSIGNQAVLDRITHFLFHAALHKLLSYSRRGHHMANEIIHSLVRRIWIFFSNKTFSFRSIAGGQLPRTHICIFERNLAEPEWYGFTPAINRIVDTRCMVIGKFSIGLEYLVIDSHCTLMLLICSCTS